MTNPIASSVKTVKFCAFVGKTPKQPRTVTKHTSAFIAMKPVQVVLASVNATRASAVAANSRSISSF